MDERENSILEVAKKFGSDKTDHGYIPYYSKHLPNYCRTLMEIGVAEAKSALMWDELYGSEKLELHLVDLFSDQLHVSQRYCWNRGWQTHKGNQSDIDFLYTIKEMFDVIVEDGSHNSYDQIISFKHFFVNNLKSGGLWVTEDLHCCNDEFYRQSENVEFEDTLLSVFKKYADRESLLSRFFHHSENDFFKANIKELKIYDDKICFIIKK